MKRVSVPILFLALMLLLSMAFAREPGRKETEKDANRNDAEYPAGWGRIPGWVRHGWGGGPGWGHHGWGGGPGWGRHGWGGRPGWGGGPGWGKYPGWGSGPGWGCRYQCFYGCCSAEEFAEFVQAQGIPQN